MRKVMPHVFISYVRENRDVVDRLASELTSRGVAVWLDRNKIEPGARWRDAIKNAIQSGNFFLACFSRESNERYRSYMYEELTLAVDELRQRPSSRTWFIPVIINETTIPAQRISSVEDLSDIQALRLYENWRHGVERILRVIKYDDPVAARVYSLIDAFRRPFHHERLFALQQLGSIGSAAADAVPALAEALKDQNAEVRQSAADALGRIGPAAADAVPVLVEALKDQNAHVRRSAAKALRGIGPAAVPALAEALKDQDAEVRQSAADALGGIGPAAVPALAEALKDQDTDVRHSAADALRRIGPAAAGAVPALAEALKDQDTDVRQSAAYALERIGPAAAGAVPALVEALKDQDEDVRWCAAHALESLRQNS
jgi:HEAT repeat protein